MINLENIDHSLNLLSFRIPHSTYRARCRCCWYVPLLYTFTLRHLISSLLDSTQCHKMDRGTWNNHCRGYHWLWRVCPSRIDLVIDHSSQANSTGQSLESSPDSQSRLRDTMVSSSARLSVLLRSLLKSGLNSSVTLVHAWIPSVPFFSCKVWRPSACEDRGTVKMPLHSPSKLSLSLLSYFPGQMYCQVSRTTPQSRMGLLSRTSLPRVIYARPKTSSTWRLWRCPFLWCQGRCENCCHDSWQPEACQSTGQCRWCQDSRHPSCLYNTLPAYTWWATYLWCDPRFDSCVCWHWGYQGHHCGFWNCTRDYIQNRMNICGTCNLYVFFLFCKRWWWKKYHYLY